MTASPPVGAVNAEEEDDEVAADIFGEGEGALDPMALLAGAPC